MITKTKIFNSVSALIIIAMMIIPFAFLGHRAGAAGTGAVSATITPQNISIAVTDGSVAYGTLDLSSSSSTTSGGINDTQVATNDGNITEDFNILSSNATGGTGWTLAGSAGSNQFVHSFCTTGAGSPDPCDTTPTWTAMTTGYQSLSTAIAASGTKRFDLKIDTPTATTDYVQKSISVTVQAVAN